MMKTGVYCLGSPNLAQHARACICVVSRDSPLWFREMSESLDDHSRGWTGGPNCRSLCDASGNVLMSSDVGLSEKW